MTDWNKVPREFGRRVSEGSKRWLARAEVTHDPEGVYDMKADDGFWNFGSLAEMEHYLRSMHARWRSRRLASIWRMGFRLGDRR